MIKGWTIRPLFNSEVGNKAKTEYDNMPIYFLIQQSCIVVTITENGTHDRTKDQGNEQSTRRPFVPWDE